MGTATEIEEVHYTPLARKVGTRNQLDRSFTAYDLCFASEQGRGTHLTSTVSRERRARKPFAIAVSFGTNREREQSS
jgi:hypothetical protein